MFPRGLVEQSARLLREAPAQRDIGPHQVGGNFRYRLYLRRDKRRWGWNIELHAADFLEIARQIGQRAREIAAERRLEGFRSIGTLGQQHGELRHVVAVVRRQVQHVHQSPAFRVEHVFRLVLILLTRRRLRGPLRRQLLRREPRPGEKKIHVRFELLADAHAFAVDLGVGVQLGRAFFEPARQRRGRLVQQEVHELVGHHARQLTAAVGHDIVALQAALIEA